MTVRNHCQEELERDEVAFRAEGEKVRIAPVGCRLDASYMAVPALKRPLTLREMAKIAREEQAEQAAGEGF